ncbi:class I SAM-dependent methyltransferase [Rhodopseudomonas palustris]|uniref:Possible methyltransferases n=2 Tax=Rhodopseudomonas palustris (strain ATCC BAA-98 / CGA009) TaxID=258594 RepID=Q6NBR5_RHOPA|nr:class I SAM-dependent methyltransferase [Rhodopseudomonas palustris]CAE26207.1 possible methyltransferases [Rhodopseudomonas palustris CGA009]
MALCGRPARQRSSAGQRYLAVAPARCDHWSPPSVRRVPVGRVGFYPAPVINRDAGGRASMTSQRGFWDRMAERYAARPIKDVAAYEAMLADAAGRLSPSDRVLEIGCGTGGTAIRLAPGVAQWTATDLSPEMVRIASAKPAPPNLSFVVADADLSTGEPPYDAVCAFLILHLVDDIRTTLSAIRDWLKPGGLLLSKTYCIGDMNPALRWGVIPVLQRIGWVPPIKSLMSQQLRAAIAEAGFEIEASRTFGSNSHAHYIVARKPA